MPGIPMFRALWTYRSFVVSSVLREFNAKYRESLLGGFWAIANPLAMIVIYTVIFGQLMRPTLPGHEKINFAFSIYLCAGIISWGLFSEMIGRLNGIFLEYGYLIKKSNLPRICLPAIATLSALVNFGIILGVYLLFLLLVGHWPGWSLLAIVPLLVLQIFFAIGLGIFLGTLNVFFRDVGQLTAVVLQFWFWLTPVVYTLPALPGPAQSVLQYNPLVPLITAYQQIFLEKALPDFSSLWPLLVLTCVLLVLGAYFFLARVGEMVDEL